MLIAKSTYKMDIRLMRDSLSVDYFIKKNDKNQCK
jgi:hypothetical protein